MIHKSLEENHQDKEEWVFQDSIVEKHIPFQKLLSLDMITAHQINFSFWRLLVHVYDLEHKLYESKQQINASSEELAIMVSAFKENQLQIKAQQKTSKGMLLIMCSRSIKVYVYHVQED